MIKVVCSFLNGQMVVLHHVGGVGEEEVGVGLQVDDAAIDEKLAIALHEIGRRESLAGVLHLRVAEGEPDLLYLVLGKESLDDLDVRAEEGDVLQSFLECLGGTSPHAGTLDVDTDEIDVGVELGELHRVFTLATAQFEHDGVIVVEILLAPVTTHLERHIVNDGKRILEDILVGLHICEFS